MNFSQDPYPLNGLTQIKTNFKIVHFGLGLMVFKMLNRGHFCLSLGMGSGHIVIGIFKTLVQQRYGSLNLSKCSKKGQMLVLPVVKKGAETPLNTVRFINPIL